MAGYAWKSAFIHSAAGLVSAQWHTSNFPKRILLAHQVAAVRGNAFQNAGDARAFILLTLWIHPHQSCVDNYNARHIHTHFIPLVVDENVSIVQKRRATRNACAHFHCCPISPWRFLTINVTLRDASITADISPARVTRRKPFPTSPETWKP